MEFKKKFAVSGVLLSAVHFLATVSAADDLFISEYVEGSSLNKAIEIYNNTGASIDLSSYELQYYFNGNTSPGRTLPLVGVVQDLETFVIAEDAAVPESRDQAREQRDEELGE